MASPLSDKSTASLFAFSILYFAVELVFVRTTGRMYTTALFEEILRALKSLGRELGERDWNGGRLCGMLLAIILIAVIVSIGFTIHEAFGHPGAGRDASARCIVVAMMSAAATLVFAWLNQQYVSWVVRKGGRGTHR